MAMVKPQIVHVLFIAMSCTTSGVRVANRATGADAQFVMHLYSNATATKMGMPELDKAFSKVYDHYNNSFDFKASIFDQRCGKTLFFKWFRHINGLRPNLTPD